MEDFTVPRRVRAAVYVIVVMGTAVIVPLNLADVWVTDVMLAVWTSVSAAASLLARLNMSSK